MTEILAAPRGDSRARAARASSCTFCGVAVDPDLALTLPDAVARGWRQSPGSFCSSRCVYCVLALAALHPSVLEEPDFLERRGLLTDSLLLLWRSGKGPDPARVLQAAERASARSRIPS
jgi:hypothetical protein